MKVIWTAEAEKTYEEILDNLFIRWTNKETEKFINDLENTILLITLSSYMFQEIEQNKNIRKGYINKLVSMFYKVDMQNKTIWIVDLWNNRQNLHLPAIFT